jgi:glycosyltransferase involved in cell wall biosynthesis
LAQAIGEAASAAARLPEMGAAGRQIVEREFAWPILADQHIAMYETLLAGVAGRSPAAT